MFFEIVSSQVGCKVTEVRYILGVRHILLWCNSDVNFCKDHCDKTEVPVPLAVDDLISWRYELNNGRKLARLITYYENIFFSEGTAALLLGVRSERRLKMGVRMGWERNLFHIPWFWPIQETMPSILTIPNPVNFKFQFQKLTLFLLDPQEARQRFHNFRYFQVRTTLFVSSNFLHSEQFLVFY